MSENLIKPSDESASEFLFNLAEESFKKEKVLYDNSISSVEDLINVLLSEKTYSTFQTKMTEKIFQGYEFLIDFCDQEFISKIISVGQIFLREKLKELSDLSGGEKFDNLFKTFFTKNNIDLTKNKKISKRELKTSVEEISGELCEKLFPILINDQGILQNVKKRQENIIKGMFTDALTKSFLSSTFRFKEEGSRGGAVMKNDEEYELLSLEQIGNRIIGNVNKTAIESAKKGKIKPFLNKNELTKIIRVAIHQLQKDLKKRKEKSWTEIEYHLNTADNEFVCELQEVQKKSVLTEGETIYSQTFFNVVKRSLKSNYVESFESFWRKNKQHFNTLLENNSKKFFELQSANSLAAVAGELGELMVACFLQCLSPEQQKLVQIFGQEKRETGSAAVDIGFDYACKKIGFQIKNYTSASSSFYLYAQSNDLNDNYIQRYLGEDKENSFLRVFKNIVKFRKVEDFEKESQYIEDNLNKSIPYYLRYDEAFGINEKIKDYKNNFIIINFKVIPTSVLFYLLAIEIEKEESKREKGMFFFSEEKQDTETNLVSKNFCQSYKDTVQNSNIPRDLSSIYLNFIGLKINFKKSLNQLF